THDVSFSFIFAAELQKVNTHSLPGNLRGGSRHATNDLAANAENPGEQTILLRLRSLSSAMPKKDVGQFVGHDSSHLTFAMRRFDHAAVHIHWAARQGERVNVACVYYFEIILELRMLKLRRNRIH